MEINSPPQTQSPLDIEVAAKRNERTMKEVCAQAGVAYSTFWRWKAQNTKIALDAYTRIVAAANAPKGDR